ncbi:hypothetical protein CYMTET_22650 [Cymbomonas tetramitiformis]|uniref:N-acetyltransferase domain-containing protein n=1 Tax=Cymbomonas tetramitiformis TaxID=36881 RepID=A0AAE0FZT0_9CHLO|nr:hypothetical protein CYMTET_22650 [Cymbomonas tetramitiformis]
MLLCPKTTALEKRIGYAIKSTSPKITYVRAAHPACRTSLSSAVVIQAKIKFRGPLRSQQRANGSQLPAQGYFARTTAFNKRPTTVFVALAEEVAEVESCSSIKIYRVLPQDEGMLRQVATLRAEVFYEDQGYTRFIDSFKRQFAQQELRALRIRIQQPLAACFVAVEAQASGQRVVGCADVRLPYEKEGDLPGAYLSNLCVDTSARRQGIASKLITHGARVVQDSWGMGEMHCHVYCANNAALTLYLKHGFHLAEDGCNVDDSDSLSALNRALLLQSNVSELLGQELERTTDSNDLGDHTPIDS